MLIKARPVAGDAELGAEFLEMIQPFRYPRSLAEGTFRGVTAMKSRLENEVVKAGELERNVKLGRGGIREVEFIVQTLQFLHAGKQPFLQEAATIPALEKLASYHLLSTEDAKTLGEAYLFLRDVEHRLQMEAGQQTHTIPTARQARERLARLMGFDSLAGFESARQAHARQIRRLYEKILGGGEPARTSPLPGEFAGHEGRWKEFWRGTISAIWARPFAWSRCLSTGRGMSMSRPAPSNWRASFSPEFSPCARRLPSRTTPPVRAFPIPTA